MITFVTAFIQGDFMKRSRESYKQYFDTLAATGLPFVLFLDKRVDWTFPSNVFVYPISLEECWVSSNVPQDVILPELRLDNTREYLMIQNSKPEFLWRAANLNVYNTEWFAWIDFGIVHVFKQPQQTLQRLCNLKPPTMPGVYTAGIWPHKNTPKGGVCWRFAGGFQLIHRDFTPFFWNRCQQQIIATLPYLTWEVNNWAEIESSFPLGWFPADHNDSIIPFTNSAW